MDRTIAFVAAGVRCRIRIETPRDLQRPDTLPKLAMTGDADGHSGQCYDSIREAIGDDAPAVARMLDIWTKHHLKPVPADIAAELETLGDQVDGMRFGEAPDVSDAPEIGGDFFDSRDVIKAVEIYRDAMVGLGFNPDSLDGMDQAEKWPDDAPDIEDDPDAQDIVKTFLKLRDLDEEGGNYSSDWRYGSTCIADDYFATYAEEFASDIGAISREEQWPLQHIDWDAAADALKADYTAIEFDGSRYWVR